MALWGNELLCSLHERLDINMYMYMDRMEWKERKSEKEEKIETSVPYEYIFLLRTQHLPSFWSFIAFSST